MTTTAKKKNGLSLKVVSPCNVNQERAFNKFFSDNNLLLHGIAGTGKTYIAMYLALKRMHRGDFSKVSVIRSVVSTRDMGFLPGSVEEKAAIFETPYVDVVTDLYGRGDAYGILKQKNELEFLTTSFVRGLTINDTVLIIDEAQNMNYHELSSVITRIGTNTKLILCGDVRQDDLTNTRFREFSGLRDIMKILKKMNSIYSVEFTTSDIVRSDFVRDFIVARDEFERLKNEHSSSIEDKYGIRPLDRIFA